MHPLLELALSEVGSLFRRNCGRVETHVIGCQSLLAAEYSAELTLNLE